MRLQEGYIKQDTRATASCADSAALYIVIIISCKGDGAEVRIGSWTASCALHG